jgi:hypothetical protein
LRSNLVLIWHVDVINENLDGYTKTLIGCLIVIVVTKV